MVLDQAWPKVDHDFKIPLKVKNGNRTMYTVPLILDRDRLDSLTTEQAVDLAKDSHLYTQNIGPEDIIEHTNLSVVPRYGATLVFTLKGGKRKKKTSKKFHSHKHS